MGVVLSVRLVWSPTPPSTPRKHACAQVAEQGRRVLLELHPSRPLSPTHAKRTSAWPKRCRLQLQTD